MGLPGAIDPQIIKPHTARSIASYACKKARFEGQKGQRVACCTYAIRSSQRRTTGGILAAIAVQTRGDIYTQHGRCTAVQCLQTGVQTCMPIGTIGIGPCKHSRCAFGGEANAK